MAYVNFVIPQRKSELLTDNDFQYYVRNVVTTKEIQPRLQEARQYFKEVGSNFILENFDIYYSVLHHADGNLPMDVIVKAFQQLHRAVQSLNNDIGYYLNDKDSLNEELKQKCLNTIKMLLYIYTNIAICIHQKIELKKSHTIQKGRARKKDTEGNDSEFDKKAVILAIHNIIQRELNLFWDPPVVEESFVTMVAEICYRFLESNSFKSEKETRFEVFNMLGTLIKSYSHGMMFVIRVGQLIKMHEHLITCIPEGIQILVQKFNCKGLVRDFIREITEWQTDEKLQDVQGSRYCASVLFEMANLMPTLMIPEVMYLTDYLSNDSYNLRNSVLHVISEVVLRVLTKPDLDEEQRESRDSFLNILYDHIRDISAHVRSKVFQEWSKLQRENAIPQSMQLKVLERAVEHLRDKGAIVRKSAAICVTTFLSHNIYSANLQLEKMVMELEEKQTLLDNVRKNLENDFLEKLKEVQQSWATKENKMRAVIKEKIKGNMEISSESTVGKTELAEMVRVYVLEDKFEEAFEICKNASAELVQWREAKKDLDEEQQINVYLALIRSIFIDITQIISISDGDKPRLSEEDLKNMETLENTVAYLKGAIDFLKLIDSAITPMTDLLESISIGDFHEAIEFFIAAYQFNISNALTGVLAMLKIMQRNEKERKDCIVNAFKTIYLTTDSTNIRDHTQTIVERMIKLLCTVPFEKLYDLHLIVSEWVASDILDNSIIDMLWQYVTKKVEVTDDQSRAALYLLMMTAMGRRTIITKNIKLVATIAFSERGRNDLFLVTIACQMLQIAGRERQNIVDDNPPFRIKPNDPMWLDLLDILVKNFFADYPYYNSLMSEAVECIYRLCSKPEAICNKLIENITNAPEIVQMNNNGECYGYIIARYAHLLGCVAIKQLNYLDEVVYKELKRRRYKNEMSKVNKKTGKGNRPLSINVQNASSSFKNKNISSNTTNKSVNNGSAMIEDSLLEGAQAEDEEAEIILKILEKDTVSAGTGLGNLAHLLIEVCEKPDSYDDPYLQTICITALLRYMIVSCEFCEKNIRLIFTVLKQTKYPEVKTNILIHCSDLLERFPNVIEPWTAQLYNRLNDECTEVRISAFFMLSNLILRDMIRVKGHISKMAVCIVDGTEYLKNMSRNFFTQLSQKANNLYNVIPDIFSHLCKLEFVPEEDVQNNAQIPEEDLREIMKFLFGLITKSKHMESLVERFCVKLVQTDQDYPCRNIAYCLSLIQYTETGFKHLIDKFPGYKNNLVNEDVYGFFMQIINACNKNSKEEMKKLVADMKEIIKSVFEIKEDGPNGNDIQPKSAFKKPRSRAPKKTVKKKAARDDSSDEEDFEGVKENVTPAQRSGRVKRGQPQPRRRVISDSDSD